MHPFGLRWNVSALLPTEDTVPTKLTDRSVAYVDESGRFGLVRDIFPERDDLIGVLAAVVFAPEQRRRAVERLTPAFEAFATAAPPGAKLHITDAFAAGNEDWAAVAVDVRKTYLAVLAELCCPITYAARRHGVARSHRQWLDDAIDAHPSPSSPVRLVGAERPDAERIESTIMKYLALRLDAYAEDHRSGIIDLVFDAADEGVMRRYQAAVERTRSISGTTSTTHGWHLEQKRRVSATVTTTVSSPIPVDVRFVGDLRVSAKDDPLVLAADIVANGINHQLRALPADAALHRPESLASWPLSHLVWGNRDNPIEDIL